MWIKWKWEAWVHLSAMGVIFTRMSPNSKERANSDRSRWLVREQGAHNGFFFSSKAQSDIYSSLHWVSASFIHVLWVSLLLHLLIGRWKKPMRRFEACCSVCCSGHTVWIQRYFSKFKTWSFLGILADRLKRNGNKRMVSSWADDLFKLCHLSKNTQRHGGSIFRQNLQFI